MENIEKIANPSWLPDEEDILYARLRTTGMLLNIDERLEICGAIVFTCQFSAINEKILSAVQELSKPNS